MRIVSSLVPGLGLGLDLGLVEVRDGVKVGVKAVVGLGLGCL